MESSFPREFAADPIGAELSMRVILSLTPRRPPMRPQGYRMFKTMSTRKLSSQAARLSLPRNEVFVSG